jgi:hypothetical protein
MTTPVGKPSVTAAPRKAVIDHDSPARDRLGEIRQQGGEYLAFDRRGNHLGAYPTADQAIEAIRTFVAGLAP